MHHVKPGKSIVWQPRDTAKKSSLPYVAEATMRAVGLTGIVLGVRAEVRDQARPGTRLTVCLRTFLPADQHDLLPRHCKKRVPYFSAPVLWCRCHAQARPVIWKVDLHQGDLHYTSIKRLMCVVCCPYYRTSSTYTYLSLVVRTYKRLKGRFTLFFLRCLSPMRDGLRRICESQIRRKTSQTFYSQNPFSCAFVGLRTPLNNYMVVSIGGASRSGYGQPVNPYVHNDCPGSAGLGNASSPWAEVQNYDFPSPFEVYKGLIC